jgi:hypothetical protein
MLKFRYSGSRFVQMDKPKKRPTDNRAPVRVYVKIQAIGKPRTLTEKLT